MGKLVNQDVIIYYGKDYLMVTQGIKTLVTVETDVDAHVVGIYKRLYEKEGYIILDVINTDA